MIPQLSVTINHASPRVLGGRDRQWIVLSGVDFAGDGELRSSQSTWIDPITHRLMLMPGPVDYYNWTHRNDGMYAKVAFADYTLTTPASWVADEKFTGAGVYLMCQVPDGKVVTTQSFVKNQAMFVSFFGYGAGDVHIVGEFWYGNAATVETAAVGWRLFSNGDVELWKNGIFLATKKMGGGGTSNVTKQESKQEEAAQAGMTVENSLISIMIIPFANREIMLITPDGHGFSHCYGDIDETDTNPTITPAGQFSVNVPAPATANFQVAKVQWATSGYAVSRMASFGDDPTGLDGPYAYTGEAARTFSFTDYGAHPDPDTFLLNPAGTGAFMPPPAGDYRCRVKVGLSGDGTYTPVVYGLEAYFAAQAGMTNPVEAFVLDRYILEATLEIQEQRDADLFTMLLKSPKTLDGGSARGLLVDHTPVRVKFGRSTATVAADECVVMDGVISKVTWLSEVADEVQRATVQVRSPFKLYEDYLFQDIKVLDGLELSIALKFLAKRIGLADTDLDLETTALILGLTPAADANDWNYKIEATKSAASEISQLIDDQAAGWPCRFAPKVGAPRPIFRFESPATRDGRPAVLTLYTSRALGVADGQPNDDQLWKRIIRKMEHGYLEPEANDIRIIYIDPRDGRVKVVRKTDAAAADPTVAPSARSANWTSTVKRAGLATNKITRDDVAQAALKYLYDRVAVRSPIAQIDCEMLFKPDVHSFDSGGNPVTTMGEPVWPGVDRLKVDAVTYPVMAMSVHFFKEPDETYETTTVQYRDAHYVLGAGSGNYSGGSTMQSILDANAIRAASGFKWPVRPGAERLILETPKLVKLVA